MGIKSLNKNESYYNFFGASGLDAVNLHPYYLSWTGNRGVWQGGRTGSSYTDTIDYVDIPTPGDATDFGNLTDSRAYTASCSSGSRGVCMGG